MRPNIQANSTVCKRDKNQFDLDEQLLFHKKHFSTADLPDNLKSNLGKYYTPPHLVAMVKELVQPYARPYSLIMDLAAGCGAFLDTFPDNPWIIRDIDEDAVNFLCLAGYIYARQDNSLAKVSRAKYRLRDDEHIICLGNPPYNDITSLNKRQGQNAKREIDFVIDPDIRSNDLGTSFLRAFNKLEADVICVLHPLSYLIKKSNFENRLKNFKSEYRLQKGVIFSSNEFTDTQGTPFPIVAALYLRDIWGMDYGYITDFPFQIYKSEDIYILSDYETTDGYIKKYSPTHGLATESEIGLYMHNFRDLNSLKTVGNLSDTEIPSVTLPVELDNLYKYAYLNTLRRYFPKDFRWGNLSPLVLSDQLDSDIYLQDACIIDTILNNQRLKCFSDVESGTLMAALKLSLLPKVVEPKLPDIYQMFRDFIHSGSCDSSALAQYLKSYFIELPQVMRRKKQKR